MTKRRRALKSANPNLVPVSPKRGLAGSSGSRRTNRASSSRSPRDAPPGSSQPPSSPSTRPRRQTRSTKPANLAQLPTPAEIRKKREWTYIGEARKSDDGKYATVRWKDTIVPAGCLRHEKETGRTYVKADGIRHYIQKKSHGEVDDKGQATWHCVWEEEKIPAEMLQHLNCEDSSDYSTSESDSDDSHGGSSDSSSSDSSSSGIEDSGSDSESDTEPSSSSQPSTPAQTPSSSSRAVFSGDSPTTPRPSIETSAGPAEQQRSPTAASSLYFGNPPNPRPTKLHFAVTSDTADYGPDLQALIVDQIGKELKTTTNRSPGILKRRRGGRAVRPVHFKPWTVGRKDHKINVQLHQNAEAILVHMQGDDVVEPCNVCDSGLGVMQGCVVADDFGKGECTNCHYGSRGTKCCFRKDTKAECGYRAAKVVKRRAPARKKSRPAPARPTTPRSSPPQAAAPRAATPDWHRGLVYSERDFVHGPTASPRNGGDAYVMSGGLGDMAVTPVQDAAQKHPPRSRSRSIDSSEEDDMPLTKRSRREVIDLITPVKTEGLKRAKTEPSSAARDQRSGEQTTGRLTSAAANADPPSSPPQTSSAGTRSVSRLIGTSPSAQCTSNTTAAVRSPEITTSGRLTTGSAARLKQRKQQATAPTATKKKKKEKTSTSAAPEKSRSASSAPAPDPSAALIAATKQADGGRQGSGGTSAASTKDAADQDSSWRRTESAIHDTPRFGVPSRFGMAAGTEATPSADQPFMSKQAAGPDAGAAFPSGNSKHGKSLAREPVSSIKASEAPSQQKQEKRHETKQSRHDAHRRKKSSQPQRAPSSSPTQTDATGGRDARPSRKIGKDTARRGSGEESSTKTTTSSANTSRRASSQRNNEPAPAAAAETPTITDKLQHSPPAQPSAHTRSPYPETRAPNPHKQAFVHTAQRFARGELTATRFSYIWHHCDSTTQDLMRRLLRWAWHERRAPVTASLADFFSRCDEEREWLNECVVPAFCPPEAEAQETGKGRAVVVELDGSSDEEDEDGVEGYVEVVQEGDEDSEGSESSGESSESESDESDED